MKEARDISEQTSRGKLDQRCHPCIRAHLQDELAVRLVADPARLHLPSLDLIGPLPALHISDGLHVYRQTKGVQADKALQ